MDDIEERVCMVFSHNDLVNIICSDGIYNEATACFSIAISIDINVYTYDRQGYAETADSCSSLSFFSSAEVLTCLVYGFFPL